MVGTPINLVRGLIRLCTVVLIKDPVWQLLSMHRPLKWQRHKEKWGQHRLAFGTLC